MNFASFPTRFALFFACFLLCPPVQASESQTTESQLTVKPGLYTTIPDIDTGTACPAKVNITNTSNVITPNLIELDGHTCIGTNLFFTDVLALLPNTVKNSISMKKLLNATLTLPLICGPHTLEAGTNIIVLALSKSLPLEKITLFNAFLPVGLSLPQMNLSAGIDYIATSTMCLWRQTAPASIDDQQPPHRHSHMDDSPEPTPDYSPFMQDGVTNTDAACFPASATVQLHGGSHVRMDALRTGQRVRAGASPGMQVSTVFAWTHADRRITYPFVRLHTRLAAPLVLTRSHFVHLHSTAATTAFGHMVPASEVRVGAKLVDAHGDPLIVTHIDAVREVGLYNPQTLQGDIVVDGVLVSTYTQAVPPLTAHALLAPVRAVHHATRAVWASVSHASSRA